MHLSLSRLEIPSVLERRMQCICLFHGLQVGRTQLLGEYHLRVLWEPNQASERNLLLLVIAFERKQPLLLGLQLHETSGQVDASVGSRTQLRIFPAIRCLR